MIKSFFILTPKIKFFPRLTPNFYFSNSSKPYYPIKKLDFSNNQFQCIYRNNKLKDMADFIGKSIMYGFAPSAAYLAAYLAFLDMSNIWNNLFLGFTFAIGVYHAWARIKLTGYFLYELHIHESGKRFKVLLTKNALKYEEKNLIKIEFDEEKIRERNFIKYEIFEKSEEVSNKDVIVFTVNEKIEQKRSFDVKIFMKNNHLENYNDYIIALGKGQKIMMK